MNARSAEDWQEHIAALRRQYVELGSQLAAIDAETVSMLRQREDLARRLGVRAASAELSGAHRSAARPTAQLQPISGRGISRRSVAAAVAPLLALDAASVPADEAEAVVAELQAAVKQVRALRAAETAVVPPAVHAARAVSIISRALRTGEAGTGADEEGEGGAARSAGLGRAREGGAGDGHPRSDHAAGGAPARDAEGGDSAELLGASFGVGSADSRTGKDSIAQQREALTGVAGGAAGAPAPTGGEALADLSFPLPDSTLHTVLSPG